MALFNYTGSPYLAEPHSPTTDYFQPPEPLHVYKSPQSSYSYPPPEKQFLVEEYTGNPPYFEPQHGQERNSQNKQQSPNRRPNFKKVTDVGTKSSVHSIIDYENEEYDHVPVTPVQGPILLKNGQVPVVPLYSHPVLQNGTFVHIPILWTALSIALGVEIRGEYIRGVPCIIKNQQLYCPSAGNSYPLDRIELFIDENKALMKRMYGEFDMPSYESNYGPGTKKKRSTKPGIPNVHFDPGPDPIASTESINKSRSPRQNFRNNQSSESGRIDACESKVEIVTPYWASNSAGKIRAIVNTQHFEQAIHQEVCAKTSTKRCTNDCGCEQKYKWHRLLAYDPDNDCKGIFMDWFLFPSCCVCRCASN